MDLRLFLLAGVIAAVGVMAAPSTAGAGETDIPKHCAVPAKVMRTAHPLPRIAIRLHRGEPVRIVAIGSSSTAGTGASSPKASYPSRLEADLRALFPKTPVTVVNRGVPGDTSVRMLARFKRDAVDPGPDLIIWQTGTNSALGGSNVQRFIDDITHGIRMARSAGIEVMLMGPQFAPRFESVTNRMSYVEHLRAMAERERVPIFPRYEIMKHWIESGQFTTGTMINPDGLHLTDLSYGCLGRLVARMIADPDFGTARAAR